MNDTEWVISLSFLALISRINQSKSGWNRYWTNTGGKTGKNVWSVTETDTQTNCTSDSWLGRSRPSPDRSPFQPWSDSAWDAKDSGQRSETTRDERTRGNTEWEFIIWTGSKHKPIAEEVCVRVTSDISRRPAHLQLTIFGGREEAWISETACDKWAAARGMCGICGHVWQCVCVCVRRRNRLMNTLNHMQGNGLMLHISIQWQFISDENGTIKVVKRQKSLLRSYLLVTAENPTPKK